MRLIFNWKQGLVDNQTTIELLETYKRISNDKEVVICPNILKMESVAQFMSGLLPINGNISLGLQDFQPTQTEKSTGDTELDYLTSYNPKYCLIGHSETRVNKKLTEDDILNRLIRARNANIKPILCVGFIYPGYSEIDSIRFQVETIKRWIQTDPTINLEKDLILAYEPLSSIGTGITQEENVTLEIIGLIKQEIGMVELCYGGSVTPKNINSLRTILGINNFLIGSAGLNKEIVAYF